MKKVEKTAIIISEAGKSIREHCDESGFIIRYPAGSEAVTGRLTPATID